MAIISKILSLPSATQYEPQASETQSTISYVSTEFGSGSAGNGFYFNFPPLETFWKNKASTVHHAIVEYYDSSTSSFVQASSNIVSGNALSVSSSRIGVRHRIRTYARANGTDIYSNTIREYYPQTKPNKSPQITSYSIGPYQMSATWSAIGNVNWGGAPSNSINDDRQYEFIIHKNPGTQNSEFVVQTLIGESLSYTFGGSFSGNYRIIIYAVNKAGDSTYLFPDPPISADGGSATPVVFVQPPPPPPPYFFCIQADTPIMVWLDNKITYKKAKEIVLGDRLVSYSFEELPKYESTYDVSTWSSDSFTPVSIESADVVSIKKHKKDKTVYINGDINTRMSIDHSVFIKNNDSTTITTAGLLEVGDTIFKFNNETMSIIEIEILSIDLIEEETDVFEIDCSPYDVFFAGDILTHNYKPPIY